MKLLTSAAVAAWLVAASVAMAQTTPQTPTPPVAAPAGPPATSHCGTPPAQPSTPDGSTMTAAQFQAATTTFNAWVVAVNTNLQCRAAEVHELDAQAQSLTAQYRAEADAGKAASDAMQAQQAANQAHLHPGHAASSGSNGSHVDRRDPTMSGN